MTIDVTERCNLACAYCYKGPAGSKGVDIPSVLRTMEVLWPVITEHGGLTVAFMGGEPLIALDDALRLASELSRRCSNKGLSFSWSMTSNLTLLTPERATRVLKAGGAFHCSVDGCPVSHDRNRPYAGGRGSSSTVMQHVDILRERGALRGARMTVTPATVGQMFDGVRHLQSLGFTTIAAFPAFDRQTWSSDLLLVVQEQTRLIGEARLTQFASLSRLHPIDSYARLLLHPPAGDGYHCGACHSFLGIDIHGRIFPCHRFTGQSNWEGYELRTLDGEGPGSWSQLRALFNTREVPERCHRCPALGACRGGCWAENLSATGTLSEPAEISCAYNLALLRGIEASGLRAESFAAAGSCNFCNPCIMCDICLICNGCNNCDICDRCNEGGWRGLNDGGCAVPAGSV
ncbi:SPASM domain-containing protein [Candidatus Uhrbacteria bacterium]|nr:SPASM domain-containing protein [Candidatus Uhrbacteria bacterium]